VPKARFDEVATKASRLADENAYLRGKLDAMAAGAGGQQQQPAAPAAPEPTLFDQIATAIAAEQAKVQEAASRFDNGDLSMVQFKDIEFAAATQIASLRERAMVASLEARKPAATATKIGLSDQAILDQHTIDLEAAHPWVQALVPQELQYLASLATDEFKQLGRPLGDGPADTMRLRTRVAQLATKFGPDWYPGRTVAAAQAPAAPPAQTQQRQQQQAAPRGQAGMDKLNLAGRHPPNPAAAGSPGNPSEVTAEMVDKMTTEEILALPATVRQRLLTG
jgi:hypothetical protein